MVAVCLANSFPSTPSPFLARLINMLSFSSEGELEAEWLQDVGLSTLISGAEEEDGQALLSTLTRTQAAAVQKRYNTYTQTLRKKNKHTVRDVRDIFGTSDSPVSILVNAFDLIFMQFASSSPKFLPDRNPFLLTMHRQPLAVSDPMTRPLMLCTLYLRGKEETKYNRWYTVL